MIGRHTLQSNCQYSIKDYLYDVRDRKTGRGKRGFFVKVVE